MTQDYTDEEVKTLTPESGFNLVGIDYFETLGNRLYIVEHFEMYQDALDSKKNKKKPEEYLITYQGM